MSDATELRTAVEARIPSARLLQLTAWDDASAIAVNTTRLDAACADAIAKFRQRGIGYDSAQSEHVEVGVTLVYTVLQKRAGAAPPQVHEEYREALKQLDDVRARASANLGSQRGWASFTARADDACARFPRATMDLVRKPPTNPKDL